MNKLGLLKTLEMYKDSMTEFDEKEMEYLIELIKADLPENIRKIMK